MISQHRAKKQKRRCRSQKHEGSFSLRAKETKNEHENKEIYRTYRHYRFGSSASSDSIGQLRSQASNPHASF